ncbi:MAG: hypothetical protein ABGX20_22985 [Bacillus sp. (in: firmicutes)]
MERIPLIFNATNPCNGEFITFNGTLSFFIKSGTSPSGDNIHQNIHFYLHGQGTGNLGNEYVYNDVRINTSNANFKGEKPGKITQSEISSNFTNNIISKGPAPNFTIHAVLHTTFNANGVVTAEVEILNTECRG